MVDADTGEVVDLLDRSEARDLTDRIKVELSATWDLITEAYQRRAWAALGFDTWDAYCKGEFGASRIKLPSEERREVVSSLRDAGLSTRAIAAATGASRNTVRSDLKQVGQSDPPERTEVEPRFKGGTPKPAPKVTGTDGKTYTKTTERASTTTEVTKGDAEAINDAFRKAVDPALDYRVTVDKALGKAHDLVQIDVDRAVAAAGESANGHRLLIQSIHRWCDRYLHQADRPAHLRSVQ